MALLGAGSMGTAIVRRIGAGLIISSQAACMYPIPNDIELQLVNTPTAQLKDVPPPHGANVVPESIPSLRGLSSHHWPTTSSLPMVRATSA